MIKTVLLADDDRDMRSVLEEGLARHQDAFAVVTADDGAAALEILRRRSISLVVTDLKMPRVDGFALLATIMEHYPDVPVIIITGYSTPEMERLARAGGAVDFIAKPFSIETLSRRIFAMLRRQSEGGLLRSVSSGMFLQLIEMEQKTCTIRLSDKSSGRQGALFFAGGELLDARVGERQGEAAACEIFGWDQASLSIQNDCAVKEKRVGKELRSLILEGARLKDEARVAAAGAVERRPKGADGAAGGGDPRGLRGRVEAVLGPRGGVGEIGRDAGTDRLVREITAVGEGLGLGRLVAGYLDRGLADDHLLCCREENLILSVKPGCPRDTLLQLLGE